LAQGSSTTAFAMFFALPLVLAQFRIPVTKVQKPSSDLVAAPPGTLPLFNMQDTLFFGMLLIGTPGQPFLIDFDTGSSTLWVPDKSCRRCGRHHKFNGTNSSTLVRTNETVKLQYGTGSCSGLIAYDTVTLGALEMPNTSIGLMNKTAEPFPSSPMDGLAGLAWPLLNDGRPTLLDMVEKSGELENGTVFAFDMRKGEQKGSLVFGDVSDLYPTGVDWFPVLPLQVDGKPTYGYWTLATDKILIGSKAASTRVAMVDSGTSCIVMPQRDFMVFAKGLDEVLCDGSNLPSLTFTIGGVKYVMEGKDLVHGSEEQGGCALCAMGDGKIGGGPPMWILGDNFHEKFQVGYDYTGKRVGLPKDPPQPTVAPTPAPTPDHGMVLESKIDAANAKLDLILKKLGANSTEVPNLLMV